MALIMKNQKFIMKKSMVKKIRRVENLAKNYKEFKNLIYNKLLQEYLFDIFGENLFCLRKN